MVIPNIKDMALSIGGIALICLFLLNAWQYASGVNLERQLAAKQQEVQVLSDAFVWAQADRNALAARLTAQSKLTEKYNAASKAMQEAVAANPTWAEQPVPAAVIDSLRD